MNYANRELAEAVQPEPKPRLIPIRWADIHLMPKREALIERLLDRNAMSIVFGASGAGKTFFVLDLCAHVSLGRPWRGLRVRQGTVLYLAIEGGLGIEERLTAWRTHHLANIETAPFFVIPEPIDLCRPDADVKLLLNRLAELPQKLELIVVDTMSRALSGGDENSPKDMGALITNLDRLRLQSKAHILVIHHSGKDESRGARGHSLAKAAADTEIEVGQNVVAGINSATVTKQRDHHPGGEFRFRLESVEIGQDEAGKPITSCVAVETELGASGRKATRLPPTARAGLQKLHECLAEHGRPALANGRIPPGSLTVTLPEWKDLLLKAGILNAEGNPREQFRRIHVTLINAGAVGVWEGNVWAVT
jgi:hypothetical protein